MPPRPRFVGPTTAVLALALLAAACGDETGLPAAGIPNTVDRTALHALSGTPISAPSAFRLDGAEKLVRTDQSAAFDFAFNFDTLKRAVLLPTGAAGLGVGSGLQRTALAFDSIKVAPTGGYVFDQPVVVDSGTVAIVRSRPINCLFGATVSLYAKLQVLAIDTIARRLDFQILVDENCGYRGLEPGIPKQ